MAVDVNEETLSLVRALAARRRELGLRQEDVAELAGLQQAAVARMETGRVVPRLDTVVA